MENNTLNTNPLRVMLVDDEEVARNLLERLLKRISGIDVVGKAASADEAIEMIITYRPELVFVDVQMPGKSGFQLVDFMKKLSLTTTVVFVTAHAEFAINAMKVAAFDYLLKPVLMTDLKETILRYRAGKLQQKNSASDLQPVAKPAKLKFNTRTGYLLVAPEDIIWCEADVNYTRIYFGNDRKDIVTVNLGKIEEMLSNYPFYRISRSVLINRMYLAKADRKKKQCILEKSGEKIVLEIPPHHIRELEKLLDSSCNP